MRILICASEAPLPPVNGLRLQLTALTRALAKSHEVCVVAFRWPEQTGAPPEGVQLVRVPLPGTGWRRQAGWARALLRREPVETTRLNGPMSAAVREVLAARRFDVAHVTLGMLAGVAPALGALPAVVVPLDAWPRNVEAQIAAAGPARRRALGVHLRLVRRYVGHAFRPFARVVLVTEEDAAAVRQADHTLKTAVIPNGVDAAHFTPGDEAREPGLIVFTGMLGTPSNVGAAERLAHRILPLVRERRRDARLAIVGRDAGPPVRALGRLPGVEVVGSVPDLRPWLRRAEVYACPMETGTGIKNKLLEALACGAPAVASPLACQGMSVREGAELLVAEDDRRFAEQTLRLLSDPGLRMRLGTAGRDHVTEHHDWAGVAEHYEAVYEAAAGAGRVRRSARAT